VPEFSTRNVALILQSVDNFRKFFSGKRAPLVPLLLFQESKENLYLSHNLISFETGFENISINIFTFSRNWSWEINSHQSREKNTVKNKGYDSLLCLYLDMWWLAQISVSEMLTTAVPVKSLKIYLEFKFWIFFPNGENWHCTHLRWDFFLSCVECWSALQGGFLGMQVLTRTDIQKLSF